MKTKALLLVTLATAGLSTAFYPQQGTQQHSDLGGCRADIPTRPITEAPRFELQAHWQDHKVDPKALGGVKITFVPPASSKLATANFDAGDVNKLELHVSRDNYALFEWIDPDVGDDYLQLTLAREKKLHIGDYEKFVFRSDMTGDEYQHVVGDRFDPHAKTKRPYFEELKDNAGLRRVRIWVEFGGLKSGFTLVELP